MRHLPGRVKGAIMTDEQIKMVVLSGKCIWCKGKVFGIADNRPEALKRLEHNLNEHQRNCPDARGEFDK